MSPRALPAASLTAVGAVPASVTALVAPAAIEPFALERGAEALRGAPVLRAAGATSAEAGAFTRDAARALVAIAEFRALGASAEAVESRASSVERGCAALTTGASTLDSRSDSPGATVAGALPGEGSSARSGAVGSAARA